MSRENLEIVRVAAAAWNDEDALEAAGPSE
jgi:hypothetical protein